MPTLALAPVAALALVALPLVALSQMALSQMALRQVTAALGIFRGLQITNFDVFLFFCHN